MISIKYEGNNNTIDLMNTPNLVLSNHTGLDQPISETITLSNPNLRGTQYQRSQISDRPISLTFTVYDVDRTRYKLMSVFKSGEKGVLTISNEFREGKIECVFEEMAFDMFSNPTTCTIFLRSPYPYFTGLESIINELDNVIENFVLEAFIDETEGIVFGEIVSEHSITIDNESDVESGLTIEITASETVVNPVIHNVTTNKFIGVNYTMNTGDKLTITTGTGKKKITLERAGVTANLINKLTRGSTFFQLQRGENILRSEASTGGNTMIVYVTYVNEYEAI